MKDVWPLLKILKSFSTTQNNFYVKKNGAIVLRIQGIRARATSPMRMSMILLFALLFISSEATPEILIPIPRTTIKSTPTTKLIKNIYL
jgi:hypothetical protein